MVPGKKVILLKFEEEKEIIFSNTRKWVGSYVGHFSKFRNVFGALNFEKSSKYYQKFGKKMNKALKKF